MKIVLAGATGFIGNALIKALLEEKHHLIILSRRPDVVRNQWGDTVKAVFWDAVSSGDWFSDINEADAIINLTGASIAGKRWDASYKKIIADSRILSTRILMKACHVAQQKPKTWINASAVGYYGDVPEGDVDETRHASDDFLGRTCAAWENEALQAETLGIRVVCLRIGIVLEEGGGALQKMVLPFKLFVGGPLGSGRQWLPWIHRDDLVRAVLFILNEKTIRGPVNGTAPMPVTMKQFSQTLGSVLRRPSWAPVPGFVLKIVVGEFSDSLLAGQKALPVKLQNAGFRFTFDELYAALRDIFIKK